MVVLVIYELKLMSENCILSKFPAPNPDPPPLKPKRKHRRYGHTSRQGVRAGVIEIVEPAEKHAAAPV